MENLEAAMDRIAARAESGGSSLCGLSSGFSDLDDIIGGFRPGRLIVLGARTSMGKTTLALNICDSAATDEGVGALFVSLESDRADITERRLVARSRVDGYRVQTGLNLGNREMSYLAKGFNEISRGAPLLIEDTPGLRFDDIEGAACRAKENHGIGLMVVDYLGLVEAGGKFDSREEEVAELSRRFKTLARELSIPIIVVSQLTRALERRKVRYPRLSDLRGSGALEEDADVVLLLHRPDYYDPSDQPGIADLCVAKNRDGHTDRVKLAFLKHLCRFENLATAPQLLEQATT